MKVKKGKMKMYLEMVRLKEVEDIYSLFNFDADYNGDNGEEYFANEFDTEKYDSDLDFKIAEGVEIYGDDLLEVFKHVYHDFVEKHSHYYDMWDYNAIVDDEGIIVSVSFVHND